MGSRLQAFFRASTYRYIQVGLIYCYILLGSIAALIQSVIFGGQTGGWFSVLQGIGATATISPPVIIIGGTLVVVGASLYFLNPKQQDVKLSVWIFNVWYWCRRSFYLVDLGFHSIGLGSGSKDRLNLFLQPVRNTIQKIHLGFEPQLTFYHKAHIDEGQRKKIDL